MMWLATREPKRLSPRGDVAVATSGLGALICGNDYYIHRVRWRR